MENLDFGSGGTDVMKIIPPEDSPPIERIDPVQTRKGNEEYVVTPQPELNSSAIEMDFSTPISDVMPAAPFEQTESATYTNPTTQRVTGVSPGMIGGPPTKTSKNPLGLTDEQFRAGVAGLVAVIAFSKPVQDKLADLVPKFLTESGALSTTGMVISAVVAAVLFYFASQFLTKQ